MMEDALRIIISKSPNATMEAMQCLQAIRVKSPVLQLRYNHCVTLALNDPAADFTPDERALIAEYIDSGTEDDNRDFTFRLRLTPQERADLIQRAEVAGQSQSEYVRRLIWPPQH